MRLEPDAGGRALRAEFRDYLAALMTPERRAATLGAESGPAYRETIRRMGRDGWLTPGWPVEYGGRGLSPRAQKIVLEELVRAEAPFPFVTVNTVGPALMRLGSAAQKRELLPRIAAGELLFAIGYSEPSAGTDLAALKTRAVRDGDAFVVTGQKIFTSGAEGADYIFLAARTDAGAARHRGISILLVDTRLPGFTLSPIYTVGDVRTNVTYYDDVRVPVSALVGAENGGWQLISEQLAHERLGLAALAYAANTCFDAVVAHARSVTVAGGPLIALPWVQRSLAECHARLRAIGTMGDRVAIGEEGQVRPEFAAAAKVFGTEGVIAVIRLLLDVTGAAGLVRDGSPGAVLRGRLEREHRRCQINTFGGGTAEVLRDIIAQVGLGLHRSAR
jgi:alkylation response protein AidB-like acyl-CoA dehydrogenase